MLKKYKNFFENKKEPYYLNNNNDHTRKLNPFYVSDGQITEQLPDCNGLSCHGLNLTSLKNLPKKVNGTLNLGKNNITEIDYPFPEIGEDLLIHDNPSLINLDNFPEEIKGRLSVPNALTSLKGSIKKCETLQVNGSSIRNFEHCPKAEIIYADDCQELESLKGIENSGVKYLTLQKCHNLKSLEYIPINISYNFHGTDHLDIEIFFVGKRHYKGIKPYFEELLDYMISNNLDLKKINWPKDFLSKNIKANSKNASRFNL